MSICILLDFFLIFFYCTSYSKDNWVGIVLYENPSFAFHNFQVFFKTYYQPDENAQEEANMVDELAQALTVSYIFLCFFSRLNAPLPSLFIVKTIDESSFLA